jgi:serine protease DegQ
MGRERHGAGVAVAPHRILTAHYLVLGAQDVAVAGLDGRPRRVRRSVVDYESGLALLHLEGAPFAPARMAEAPARPGTPVFVLTVDGDGRPRAATGHVTSVEPYEAFWEYMLDRAILTTAVNPGLAGGPLATVDAAVLGIVSLGLAAVGRFSLAVPADLYACRRGVLEGEGAAGPGRAWLGFFPRTEDGGVVVTGLVEGGPAERGGLAKGDLVLSVDGRPVSSLRELYDTLWKRGPGETVRFQVLRESALLVLDLAAGDRESFYR